MSATPLRRPVRVLSLSCVYPTALEPSRGLFIRSRLLALTRHVDLVVVAPVGLVQWGAAGRRRFGAANPAQRNDAGVAVLHARWIYPPNAGWLNGPLLFLQLLPVLTRLRRRFRWEILDAHYGHPEGVAAALCAMAFRCPYVVTIRGSELTHARYRARRWLLSWGLRRAARVIAVSDELRRLAVELGVHPERVVLVQNGVDADLFFPRPRDESRRKLGVDRRLRIVLAAGRLVAEKGLQSVLDAMRGLLDTNPDLRLAVAGSAGREGAEFERQLRHRIEAPGWRGKAMMLGEISQRELTDWMNAADVLCLASTREGCPNVVIEALASGLPVVATRVGAVPELIPTEEFGLVVPPGDPTALERALRRALDKQWNVDAIGAWGRSRSWYQVAEQLRAVFDAVTAEAGAETENDAWTSR